MSLAPRRAVSFAAVAATVIAAGLIYARLPGAGGFFQELRWLFARDKGVGLNRSLEIIEIAHAENRSSRSKVCSALLKDPDPRVVNGVLTLLARLVFFGPIPGEGTQSRDVYAGLRAGFLRWLDSTADDTKVAHIAPIVGILTRDTYSQIMTLKFPEYKYLRIFLLATLSHTSYVRSIGSEFAYGVLDPDWSTMDHRLAILDGAVSTADAPAPADWVTHVGPSKFVDALADSFPQVRWAAGRLLAVCRDERGLPAVYDWLQNDPNAPPSANQVLDELFGPAWRKPFER